MYLYESIARLAEISGKKRPGYMSISDNLICRMLENDRTELSKNIYQELRTNSKTILIYWFAYFVAAVFALAKNDPHITRMFAQGKNYLLALLIEQMVRSENVKINKVISEQPSQIFRRWNQLPYTDETRTRHCELVMNLCKNDDQILIIGDAGFLSVELCRLGFSKVSVVDMCPKVLARVAKKTAKFACQPRVLRRDLSEGLPVQWQRVFKIVITDPPCTIEGVSLFLKVAESALASNEDSHLILATHLLSQTEQGLRDLHDFFDTKLLALADIQLASAVYPFPRDLKFMLRWLLRLCDAAIMPRREQILSRHTPEYFVSDTVIVTRKERPARQQGGNIVAYD